MSEERQKFDAIGFLNGEPNFVNFVRENRNIGYGRMIQIIQTEWMALLEPQGVSSPEAVHNWFPKYVELEKKFDALQSQLARYEETLKFYGDQSNYCRQPAEEGEFRTPVLRDMGQRAREVLNVKD